MRRYHYPKLTIFCASIMLAYLLFTRPEVDAFIEHLNGLKYLGAFIAGTLYSFGFTTPFAAGFFLSADAVNPFLAAILGGIGAFLADTLIFSTIKFSMMDEFTRIEHTQVVQTVKKAFHARFSKPMRKFVLYALAGLIIASPIPDEWGVSILAGLTKIKPVAFAAISIFCNSAGILVMLLI